MSTQQSLFGWSEHEPPSVIHVSFTDKTPLGAAREYVRVNANTPHGTRCPCCGLYCKVYKRAINREMAKFLCGLVRRYDVTQDWVHVREIIKTSTFASTNATFFTHWGFITPRPPGKARTKTAGLWKPTAAGIDFAHGRTRAPNYVLLYDNKKIGVSEGLVSISDCLAKGFDLDEAMGTERAIT